MYAVSDLGPRFITLITTSEIICARVKHLRESAAPNWPELKLLTDQLTQIADEMESLLPTSISKQVNLSRARRSVH
jgi:hypothetical protein